MARGGTWTIQRPVVEVKQGIKSDEIVAIKPQPLLSERPETRGEEPADPSRREAVGRIMRIYRHNLFVCVVLILIAGYMRPERLRELSRPARRYEGMIVTVVT